MFEAPSSYKSGRADQEIEREGTVNLDGRKLPIINAAVGIGGGRGLCGVQPRGKGVQNGLVCFSNRGTSPGPAAGLGLPVTLIK